MCTKKNIFFITYNGMVDVKNKSQFEMEYTKKNTKIYKS